MYNESSVTIVYYGKIWSDTKNYNLSFNQKKCNLYLVTFSLSTSFVTKNCLKRDTHKVTMSIVKKSFLFKALLKIKKVQFTENRKGGGGYFRTDG